MSLWETLGIEPTNDERAIRKAYAAGVHRWRPDSHPQEFAKLREAYEFALRIARHAAEHAQDEREEELAAQETEPLVANGTDLVQPSARTDSPQHEPAPKPYAAAEALVAELGRCYSEQGQYEAAGLLHRQFEELSQQTIDARAEWELVFLHSLLTAANPPLSLVFEGERLFHWSARDADVEQTFGVGGARRLKVLLELAFEATYARYYTRNRWIRRLFGAVDGAPWFGFTPHMSAAKRMAAHWKLRAQEADLDAVLELSPSVIARLGGMVLWSCDVLFAIGIGLFLFTFDDPVWPARWWYSWAMAAGGFAIAMPLPWLARWLVTTRVVQRIYGWRKLFDQIPGMVTALAWGVLFIVCVVVTGSEAPIYLRVPAIAYVGLTGFAFTLLMFVAVWISIRAVEHWVAQPWQHLQRSWSVHAFDRVRAGYAPPTVKEQLRHLPRASVQDWKERRATRKREAGQKRMSAQSPFSGGSSGGSGGSVNYWWIFGALALVQIVARLVK